MAVNMQAVNWTYIISSGYANEETDQGGGYNAWTTVPDTGYTEAWYSFRDSRMMDNNNSTRVKVTVRDTWEVLNTLENNAIVVKITTQITNIVRDDPRGSTSGTRNMFARSEPNGANIWAIYGDDIATTHTISNGFTLGTYTYTINPGGEWGRSSLYFRNNVSGHDGDPVPSQYVDEFWMGIRLKNTLPERYRPGEILDGNTVWQSHNRTNGTDKILLPDESYRVMWTKEGGVASNDPPLIRHASGDKNMRKIGNNG